MHQVPDARKGRALQAPGNLTADPLSDPTSADPIKTLQSSPAAPRSLESFCALVETHGPLPGTLRPKRAAQSHVALVTLPLGPYGAISHQDHVLGYAPAGEIFDHRRVVALCGEQLQNLVAGPHPAGGAEFKKIFGKERGNPFPIAAHRGIEQEHLSAEKLRGHGFRNRTTWAHGSGFLESDYCTGGIKYCSK